MQRLRAVAARIETVAARTSRAVWRGLSMGPFAFPLQVLVLLFVATLIHLDLLLRGSGCVNWGNYILPCSNSQYQAWGPLLSTWYPFSFMGSPVSFPFTTVAGQLTVWTPLEALRLATGPALAATLFAIGSTTLLGATFILASKCAVRHSIPRLVGAILLLAGPFQLGLYGQGDYAGFIAQSFGFLALYLLWLSVTRTKDRWIYFPLSALALLMSLETIQVFELSLLLYVLFLIYLVWEASRDAPLGKRLVAVLSRAGRLVLLPLVLAPFILPAVISSAVALGPSSSYALPIRTFAAYSTSPVSVFLGYGYVWSAGPSFTNTVSYAMVSAAAGSTLALVWLTFATALTAAVWCLIVVYRIRRGYFFLMTVTLASLFGAGTDGPFGPVNTYLYSHAVGYQVLYASYMWDWVVVVPLTALAAAIVLDHLLEATSKPATAPAEPSAAAEGGRLRRRFQTWTHLRPSRARQVTVILTIAVVLLLCGTLLPPYVVSAQNGPVPGGNLVGLQTLDYPNAYSGLPGEISRLVGSQYSGVAVFNPSPEWTFNNSSDIYQNYFFYFPTARTPSLPGFATPPYPSNYYFYWVYKQLYTNATPYVGELLALAGIEYLLVFYNTQALSPLPYLTSTNVSHLLTYQSGIYLVQETKDYAIYRDAYYLGVANDLRSISILSGSYSSLNALAYAGVNLTRQAFVFPTDISPGECSNYLANASRVYADSANSLDGLALACTSYGSSEPVDYVQTTNSVNQGWTSSYSDRGALGLSIADAWPTSLAVTYGTGHSVTVPISSGRCSQNCSIWLPIRLQAQPGGSALTFHFGSATWQLNTGSAWGGYNNSMVWVDFPVNFTSPTEDLTVTSQGAFNVIGTIYVDSVTRVHSYLSNLSVTKPIVLAMPARDLTPSTIRTSSAAWSYCVLPSLASLDHACLSVAGQSTSPLELDLTMPTARPGNLSLLVVSASTTYFSLGSSRSKTIGFGNFDPGASSVDSMAWVRIPIGPSDYGPNHTLLLSVLAGDLAVSEIVFTPADFYPGPAPGLPSLDLSSPNITSSPPTLTFAARSSVLLPGVVQLSGNISFHATNSPQYLGVISFSQPLESSAGLAVSYRIAGGILLNISGAVVGGTNSDGFLQFGTSTRLVPTTAPSSSAIRISVYSQGTGSALRVLNASFSLLLMPTTMALASNVSDLAVPGGGSISGSTSGYTVSGAESSAILVRVPYYSALNSAPSGTTLTPSVGSVLTLIWNPARSQSIEVTPDSTRTLTLGYWISGLTLAGWAVAEYFLIRRSRGRPVPHRDSHSESSGSR